MRPLSQIIDFITLGSDRPIRRLVAYYVFLAAVLFALAYFFPDTDRLLLGKGLTSATATTDSGALLQDGLGKASSEDISLGARSLVELAGTTGLILIGTLLLMMPVSWVYMSARHIPGHSQAVVQTLIILPLVVAGIVLIVRDSLALAFSLAGVVAAVRFRTNLKDPRDVVYIFLSIAVGFAAGVQTLAVGAVLTIIFNFIMLSRGGTTMVATCFYQAQPRAGRSRSRVSSPTRTRTAFQIASSFFHSRRQRRKPSPRDSIA
jgi:hypothetical protein